MGFFQVFRGAHRQSPRLQGHGRALARGPVDWEGGPGSPEFILGCGKLMSDLPTYRPPCTLERLGAPVDKSCWGGEQRLGDVTLKSPEPRACSSPSGSPEGSEVYEDHPTSESKRESECQAEDSEDSTPSWLLLLLCFCPEGSLPSPGSVLQVRPSCSLDSGTDATRTNILPLGPLGQVVCVGGGENSVNCPEKLSQEWKTQTTPRTTLAHNKLSPLLSGLH